MSRSHKSNLSADHGAESKAPVDVEVEVVDGYPGPTLSDDLRQAAHAARALTKRVQAQPYGYLGAAAALGFVLGGGLWGRLGRLFLSVGARAAFSLLAEAALPPATSSHSSAHGG